MLEALEANYGYLFENELIQEISEVGHVKEIPAGELLLDYGNHIRWIPLLLEGAIKIVRRDKDGDELLLYYLERGDTCSMTLICCMEHTASEIRAVAEQDSQVVLIPVEKMKPWLKQYNTWLQFVFQSYNTRLNELFEAIDKLAFDNLPTRINKYLKDKVMILKTTDLPVTHQDIAYDLHTSRVVVSRLLKNLEKEGRIQLHRNRITVLDF